MRYLLFFLLLILASCATKQEKAIADFVQTKGDVKTDLRFKAIKTEELRPYTKADIAKLKEVQLRQQVRSEIMQIWNTIEFETPEKQVELQARLKALETDCKGTKLQELYDFVKQNSNSTQVEGYLYKCEYSIQDGSSNTVTQTDTFVLNTAKDKVELKYWAFPENYKSNEDKLYEAKVKVREQGLQ